MMFATLEPVPASSTSCTLNCMAPDMRESESDSPSRKRHRPLRIAIITMATLLVLLASTFAITSSMGMNNPIMLGRYLMTPTSEVGKLFPYNSLPTASQTNPFPEAIADLPEKVIWKGKQTSTADALKDSSTNSLIVLCGGKIVNEWFAKPDYRTMRQSSWSTAKSVVGLLVGQLINEGKLTEDTLLVDVLPEFRTDTKFDDITVQHLLDMSSGIDVSEDYSYFKPFVGVGGLMLTTNLPDYLKADQGMRFTPGEKMDYRSVDTQYLSMIVTRIEGKSLAEVAHQRLWEPMGAEDEATWNLDRKGGIEKGFMGLNATPRDFAKIGQLVLDRGKVKGVQVEPEAWIDRLAEPRVESTDGWSYSAQWWHSPGFKEAHDFTAIGVYGQYIYVNPEQATVIVKLSDYGAEQDEPETVEMFRQMASNCTG